MSENLSNFLVDLASDPDRMARFVSNPTGELDLTALSAAERQMVMSGDGGRLADALRPLKTNGSQAGGGGKTAVRKPPVKKGAKKTPAKKKAPRPKK
jgi:hypothetical protein